MPKRLSRDEVLGASDLKSEDVEVPEWGGVLRLRSMTGVERDAFETSLFVEGEDGGERKLDSRNMRARLVAATAVDEAGKTLFTKEDVEALGRKNAAALDRLFSVAQRLSGIGPAELDKARKS